MKRVVLAVLALLLVLPVALMASGQQGGAQVPVTKLRVMGGGGTPPKDDILIKYAQSKNPADVEFVQVVQSSLGDLGWVGLAQARWASGDMPEVWSMGNFHGDGPFMKFQSDKKMFKEITPDFLRTWLPNYVKRLEGYGLPIETMLQETRYINDGKNWYITSEISPTMLPKLFKQPIGQALGANQHVYALYLRDDILKKLYPSAKSEKEMKDLYLAKDGKLTVQDIVGDLPIKDMASLTDYLRKVKALNLKVGDKPVIPGAINSSSGSPGSVRWSCFTMLGVTHRWPVIFQEPPQRSYWMYTTDQFKEYLRTWNTWYNEGLLDPEIFVMKDDQYHSKVRNGEYAVINHWTPVADARDVSIKQNRGYGWRYCPTFYPLDMTKMVNWFMYDQMAGYDVWVSSKVTDEKLPGIMKWLDWQFTEEADSITYWGHPDWYTGSGKDRRYKPAYDALRLWTVYGIKSEKDGDYYGMKTASNVLGQKEVNIQPRIKVQSLIGGNAYEYSPTFVYEHKASEAGDITDMGVICESIIHADYKSKQRLFLAIGWQENDFYILEKEHDDCISAANWNNYVVKAITGSTAEFEANWKAYYDMQMGCGTKEMEDKVNADFASKWANVIQKREVK